MARLLCSAKPSVLTLSLALAFAAPQLHAATFEGTVRGNGLVLDSDGPATDAVFGSAATAGYQSSTFEGYVSSGTSRVSAISDGVTTTTSDSTLVYRQLVTNPYANAQDVAFDFFIPRSRTIIDLGYGGNFSAFDAKATFVGTITWGGQTVWSMSYGVQGAGSVATGGGSITAYGPLLSASAGGFTVGQINGNPVSILTQTSYSNCGYDASESWVCDETQSQGLAGSGALTSDPYTGLLNLGTMTGHETKELVYTLAARAEFEATYRDNSEIGSYGYGGYAQAGGYDPFGIEFTPADDGAGIALTFTTPPVPEPQTYALLAAGLLAVGAATRRRRAR